jgi:hypothetical protein
MTGQTLTESARQRRQSWLVLSFAALSVWLGGCERQSPPPQPALPKPVALMPDDAQTKRFIEQYWARPLLPQGSPPAIVAAQGITLAPESCGTCHQQQFDDWRTSLHSRAMGPGLMGQLVAMPAHAREQHQDCIRCHAPLAEQADSLVATLQKSLARKPVAADLVRPLHEHGLMCAACHVRGYEWNGPPRRDGSLPSTATGTSPHGGWKANGAFESSQFCAACHQFKDDEYALNGKLLENTYREWQDSRQAREGKACQSCHMPDRRHLWRGIHDPEMVKKGVEIQAGVPVVANGQVTARLSVANTGVGHYFPTYVTPKVVLRGYQENAAGHKIDGTAQEYIIGRQVTLDLSKEIADTRIAPDAQANFDYRASRHPDAAALVFDAEVQPDAFYLEFYLALLKDDATAGESRRLIAEARDKAKASPYILFSKRLPLLR